MCRSTVGFLVCNRIIDELAKTVFVLIAIEASNYNFLLMHTKINKLQSRDVCRQWNARSGFGFFSLTYELLSSSESFQSRWDPMYQFWFEINWNSIRWYFRSQLIYFSCCIMRCISREKFLISHGDDDGALIANVCGAVGAWFMSIFFATQKLNGRIQHDATSFPATLKMFPSNFAFSFANKTFENSLENFWACRKSIFQLKFYRAITEKFCCGQR